MSTFTHTDNPCFTFIGISLNLRLALFEMQDLVVIAFLRSAVVVAILFENECFAGTESYVGVVFEIVFVDGLQHLNLN